MNGSCNIAVCGKKAGTYHVHIFGGKSKELVPGSPFVMHLAPGPMDVAATTTHCWNRHDASGVHGTDTRDSTLWGECDRSIGTTNSYTSDASDVRGT